MWHYLKDFREYASPEDCFIFRFLCDFIYYLSLNEDRTRAAFIHVPPLSKFSAQDISASIAAAIKEMYAQVVEMEDGEQKEVE